MFNTLTYFSKTDKHMSEWRSAASHGHIPKDTLSLYPDHKTGLDKPELIMIPHREIIADIYESALDKLVGGSNGSSE